MSVRVYKAFYINMCFLLFPRVIQTDKKINKKKKHRFSYNISVNMWGTLAFERVYYRIPSSQTHLYTVILCLAIENKLLYDRDGTYQHVYARVRTTRDGDAWQAREAAEGYIYVGFLYTHEVYTFVITGGTIARSVLSTSSSIVAGSNAFLIYRKRRRSATETHVLSVMRLIARNVASTRKIRRDDATPLE